MDISGILIAGLACALIVIVSKWLDLKNENQRNLEYTIDQVETKTEREMNTNETKENNLQ